MPFMLAYLSSYLKKQNHEVKVIDALGGDPWSFSDYDNMQIQGFSFERVLEDIDESIQAVFVFFGGVVAYKPVLEISARIKSKFAKMLTILVENAQAVTAFSLKHDAENLLNSHYDVLLTGDPEITAEAVLKNHSEGSGPPEMNGVLFKGSD